MEQVFTVTYAVQFLCVCVGFFIAYILCLAARSARRDSIHCIFPSFVLKKVGSFPVDSDGAD